MLTYILLTMAKKIKKLILNGEAYDLATPSATASVA
jgi:hypothetical protein